MSEKSKASITETSMKFGPMSKLRGPLWASLCLVAGACGTPESQFTGNEYSRLHADFVPPGSHRLVQVIDLATRDQMKSGLVRTKPRQTTYEALIAAGIPDAEIRDGSVAAGIVFCCGGGITEETVVLFYIPPAVAVGRGDVVEVKVGDSPDRGLSAGPNTAVQVRARGQHQKDCTWQPEDPGLWGRVLYCQGIEQDDWVEKRDYRGIWVRPSRSGRSARPWGNAGPNDG